MDELAVVLIYMSFIMGLIGLAALLDIMVEKIPVVRRIFEWLIERMLVSDDNYEYEEDYLEKIDESDNRKSREHFDMEV